MSELSAGLDVSVDETSICVVNGAGTVLLACTATTEPEAIAAALPPFAGKLRRVGHEAGALSPWLQPGLRSLGLRWSVWRRATCARRCRPFATRPTPPTRSASRT